MDDAPTQDSAAKATGRPTFDVTVANQARIYDYLLDGKDNYEADRAAVDAVLKIAPGFAFSARANRAFLGRAVRYLAAEGAQWAASPSNVGRPQARGTRGSQSRC